MLPGWYNDNANRAYPLVELADETHSDSLASYTLANLPNSCLLDLGICLGLESLFRAGQHSVWLSAVSRSGATITFQFETDAPGVDQPLRFYRDIGDPEFATDTAEVQDLTWVDGLPPQTETCDGQPVSEIDNRVPEICVTQPLWFGFLVTGPLADLAAILPSGQSLTGIRPIEPAVIRNLADSYVRSLNIANMDRTRTTAPPGCREECLPFDPGIIFVREHCIQGDVRFVEGFNCSIRVSDRNNSITFQAGVGAGAGQVCGEVPVFACEQDLVDGGKLLSGSSPCSSLLRTIDGIGGSQLEIRGGGGVVVTPDPDHYRVVIDVNMVDLAVGYSPLDYPPTISNDLSYSPDSCDCGPL